MKKRDRFFVFEKEDGLSLLGFSSSPIIGGNVRRMVQYILNQSANKRKKGIESMCFCKPKFYNLVRPGGPMKIGTLSLLLFIVYASGIAHASQLEQELFDAAFMGKVEIARNLIARGADVNARDESGNTVLLTAVRPYGTDMVKLLVESGADVNAAGALEDTPLISASRKELKDIVRILLDAGADPNIARSDGSTALMEACIFGHREVVELLVDKGADISAKDQFGFTPLSIAKKNKHKDIVNYLKQKGATE